MSSLIYVDFSRRIWKLKYAYIKYNNIIASCAIQLWNLVSFFKGEMQANCIWK